MREPINVIRLQGYSILEQLRLEEALLRADDQNWCILNDGTNPAIVMGISGKAEELVNGELMEQAPLPLIRRFSGGGTVTVDGDTLFVSLICNKSAVPIDKCYPDKIMRWTENIYGPLFPEAPFNLRENDYALGAHKFGGNAQYLCKERWLHHSTLLWDYNPQQMRYLQLPKKRPEYRGNRGHGDFLCCLHHVFKNRDAFLDGIVEQLTKRFVIQEVILDDALPILQRPHRKATKLEAIPALNPVS